MKVDVHVFRHGPMHNNVLTSEQMLLTPGVEEYKWTTETVIGSETGKTGRVWIFEGED